jgi:peptidoglycan hydrolase-like protein with peptidoglycan-binding domain
MEIVSDGARHEPFCTVLLDQVRECGEVMFFASKIEWAGIAFTLLTTAMLAQGFPRSPAASDSSKKGVAVFVVKDEIKKVQETLRTKGYYEGKVDGVFGLRTRASIRAYQKAENLPITGQVDTRTAAGLGVRPESNWGNSESAGWELGQGSDIVAGDVKRDKPSAGIRRARASKTSRKEVSRATAMENNREGGANQQQAENEEPDQ